MPYIGVIVEMINGIVKTCVKSVIITMTITIPVRAVIKRAVIRSVTIGTPTIAWVTPTKGETHAKARAVPWIIEERVIPVIKWVVIKRIVIAKHAVTMMKSTYS